MPLFNFGETLAISKEEDGTRGLICIPVGVMSMLSSLKLNSDFFFFTGSHVIVCLVDRLFFLVFAAKYCFKTRDVLGLYTAAAGIVFFHLF